MRLYTSVSLMTDYYTSDCSGLNQTLLTQAELAKEAGRFQVEIRDVDCRGGIMDCRGGIMDCIGGIMVHWWNGDWHFPFMCCKWLMVYTQVDP